MQKNCIGVVRITPSILEKRLLWFEHNLENIAREAKRLSSFWNTNYLEIQELQLFPLSNLMRQLSDWGYAKVTEVKLPGQYANRGGILDIFPISTAHAFRIEFDGNMTSQIQALENICISDKKKKLKELTAKRPQLYTKFFTRDDEKSQNLLNSLQVGAYVVHIDHGIAKLLAVEQFRDNDLTSHASKQDLVRDSVIIKGTSVTKLPKINLQPNNLTPNTHFVLGYAQNDKLYVPTDIASEKITPYIGFGEPTLTRLGGNIWERTKRKVKEDILKTARELAHIYAKRELAKREKYDIDIELDIELEKTFPYQETRDQLRALRDIKNDTQRKTPMDRIIVGDVGFGKTEVALRAALYAVGTGHQVALVTPTTVLAHQHYKTFQTRFKEIRYPVNIEKLTRIETKTKQKEVLQWLQSGRIDIVIGTHRLLQKDVLFKNLGMLIIDEEQRFGVKQKEFFKDKRSTLDILSLSATPIPRTLSFALSGLRDISVIDTPPHGRIPIKTYVEKFDTATVKDAINRELKRNGQVYFLHNRIGTLQKIVGDLKKLLPGAKINFLHAKLPESEVIERMEMFSNKKIDVLVTTTIMENGLDFQNANTLIVDNATLLGLSQAHQIRGRIGRGDKQAYAYFLYPSRRLPHKSKQRLTALKEVNYLGAGYQIAMRDLEIRGAGSFLGREQSGSMSRVGFNLYCQMLNEAIEELRNNPLIIN